MSLKKELTDDIDEKQFDETFNVLFVQPSTTMSPEFYIEELDRTAAQYPLLGKVMEATETMALDLRDQGYDEEAINMFLRGRAVACLAVAAYTSEETEDIPEV